ncbi:MAG: thioredoxin family protein [Sulfurimonadaceae bacterium]|jgi:thioredoxin 1
MKKIVLAWCLSLSAFANGLSYEAILAKVGKEAMVLELGASTCQACKEMKKTIDAAKAQNPDLSVYIIDLRENREAAQRFKIQMIPTQVVLDKNGKEVYRHIGGTNSAGLLKMVELSKAGE